MITGSGAAVDRVDRLAPDQVTQVLELADLAGDVDGAYPLSEHVVLHLRHGGEAPAVHLLIRDGEKLTGYAHIDPTDKIEGPSAELVVHPMKRRRGLGRALVTRALDVARENDSQGRLRLWAHGDHPSAGALAVSLGFTRARVLWQMRRSLYAPIAAAPLPDGVTIRAFEPERDEQAWLAVNARAFADHPEQGRWTAADLRVRMTERWFDPEGFLVAERDSDGRLLGFHWTKIHGTVPEEEHGEPPHQHTAIGEVYVLGVDPEAHGLGLGAALTAAGLAYLRHKGLDQAMLYVDESNKAAVALYTKLGFVRWTTDTCFLQRSPARTADSSET
jgi:mycothiol synthase